MTLVLAGQVHTKETTMILEFGTKELKTLTKQGLKDQLKDSFKKTIDKDEKVCYSTQHNQTRRNK
jgi:hypothetical protein